MCTFCEFSKTIFQKLVLNVGIKEFWFYQDIIKGGLSKIRIIIPRVLIS